ncbi:hypothetical protein AOL_s00079g136 [Orbilia oligospora ATCC 24927]|uniref:Uncharacterized protein n=1 Tax=Arthrobotrys oligospora (strain ATCC 24927 / CBS 115.81 / DSM 1491) TaxID=756982 RepID=G1XD33_ARTOA|nr:hypothetical protein AOL_s00079g136 [Orbilia oligospora ATCC 24927]EGX48915.1 hypothetical protein AOL_s00079g136 [Orbilia oligospora ATCC 24927]
MSDVSPFLLESPSNDGEDSSREDDLMTELDHTAIGQAVQIDMRTDPTNFYSLDQDNEAFNVRIDINFLAQFFFRTVYLINNNLITKQEIYIIYKLVTTHHQLGGLFRKILGLKSEGARQFQETVFHFAIRDSKVELLEIYTGCEDGKLVSELLSTVEFFELECSSPEVSVMLFPYLRAPVRLPPPDRIRALDWTRKEKMERGLPKGADTRSQSARYLKQDLKRGLARLFVRFFRRLLERQLVEVNSLRIYKDDALDIENVAIRILRAALEVEDAEIADFVSSNCVGPNIFENPKIFLEVILQKDILEIKLWIRKGADVNTRWETPRKAGDWCAPAFKACICWPTRCTCLKYHHILADTVIAFSINRRPLSEQEGTEFAISYGDFMRDNQERSFGTICLLLKTPGADLNLRGVNTHRQLNIPCRRQCRTWCRDGAEMLRTCNKCRLAPRSQLNFECREESCFCSRYPLQGQLFDSIFWGLLQIEDPKLQSKVFKWIVKEQLQFNNLEDILLQSIDTVLLPSGYLNYQLFRALVEAYPSLNKALNCDRLLAEAIYYGDYDIVEIISTHRWQSGKGSDNVPPEAYGISRPSRHLSMHTADVSSTATQGPIIQQKGVNDGHTDRDSDPYRDKDGSFRYPESSYEIIEALSHEERIISLEKVLCLAFGYDKWHDSPFYFPTYRLFDSYSSNSLQKDLDINRDFVLAQEKYWYRNASVCNSRDLHLNTPRLERIAVIVRLMIHHQLEDLLSVIKILLDNNYIVSIMSLMTLFIRKLNGVGWAIVTDQIFEYLRSQAVVTETTNFIFQKIETLIPVLRSSDYGNLDKKSRRPVLNIMRPIMCALVRDELDSQMHKHALTLLENLVSVYLGINLEPEALGTLRRFFNSITELHYMIFENIRQAISKGERACQLLKNLKALEKVGWDINSKDPAGHSLFIHASMSRFDSIFISGRYAEYFHGIYIRGKVSYEYLKSYRPNLCHRTKEFDLLVFLKGLIDLGARVDNPPISKHRFETRGDFTVLLTSVRRGDYKAIELLLEHGATGFLEYGAPRYARAWFGYSFDITPAFLNLVYKLVPHCRRHPHYRRRLQYKTTYKYDLASMMNPLQYASYEGNEKVVLLLLRYGADIDNCLKDGFTALYRAAEMGRMDTVDILLKAGAKKRRLQAAEIAGKNGFHEIAKKIREFPITEDGIKRKIEEEYAKYTEAWTMIAQEAGSDGGDLRPMEIDEECLQPMEIDREEDISNGSEYISESFIGIMSG